MKVEVLLAVSAGDVYSRVAVLALSLDSRLMEWVQPPIFNCLRRPLLLLQNCKWNPIPFLLLAGNGLEKKGSRSCSSKTLQWNYRLTYSFLRVKATFAVDSTVDGPITLSIANSIV